jgi:MarR family transcriptional regulator, organic hydroperoxide resistance regulator
VTVDHAIERIQFCYPQVYYACHTRHARARSDQSHLSTRDSEILVHLDTMTPLTLTQLADHMDLSRSTLSEAVSKLEAFGYVEKAPRGRDRRQVAIVLTGKGVDAVRRTSVLESKRLHAVLAQLSKSERTAIIGGLETLARACRRAVQSKRMG